MEVHQGQSNKLIKRLSISVLQGDVKPEFYL